MNGASIMMKLLFGSCVILLVTVVAFGHLNLTVPSAAIEYNASEATVLHGSAESFSKNTPILLHDISPGSGTYWLGKTITQLTTLRGYAHAGGSQHISQAAANAKVLLIQIWAWADSNGNGQADAGDTPTEWEKVAEHTPSGGQGDVVGYEVNFPLPAIHTSTWQGDLLQGKTIDLETGLSILLLIRVVDIVGNSNLMQAMAGLEQWDNGVIDGVGSDVITDRFVDSNGNTPETTDGRIEDEDVVWLYVPRLK